MGCHLLLQEIFPSQGLNPRCRQIVYRLSHQGSKPFNPSADEKLEVSMTLSTLRSRSTSLQRRAVQEFRAEHPWGGCWRKGEIVRLHLRRNLCTSRLRDLDSFSEQFRWPVLIMNLWDLTFSCLSSGAHFQWWFLNLNFRSFAWDHVHIFWRKSPGFYRLPRGLQSPKRSNYWNDWLTRTVCGLSVPHVIQMFIKCLSQLCPFHGPGTVFWVPKAGEVLTSAAGELQASEGAAANRYITAANNHWRVFLKHLLVWDALTSRPPDLPLEKFVCRSGSNN